MKLGTPPAIVIRFDGSNLIIDATAIGGTTASVSAVLNSWSLVEFSWASGSSGSFWVNSDATANLASATFTPGSGAIETVRLGAPNGFGGLTGRAVFDEYVSNRTAAVGALLYGDANLDATVNSDDIDLVVSEYLSSSLAFGVIDCNLDGLVNAGDIDCIAAAINGGAISHEKPNHSKIIIILSQAFWSSSGSAFNRFVIVSNECIFTGDHGV